MRRKQFIKVPSIIGVSLVLLGFTQAAAAPDTETSYSLRGYREFTGRTETVGQGPSAIEVRTFDFSAPERAVIFASKIFSDYELTFGNTLVPIETSKGTADAISLGGAGFVMPLLEPNGKEVRVLIGEDQSALKTQAETWLTGAPVRRTQLTHPLFMDKWDRYCIGVWGRSSDVLADPVNKTSDTYYGWMAQVGLNPQICNASNSTDLSRNDNQLRWLRKYFTAEGNHFQVVEWLQSWPELYNRNPYLSSFDGPGMMSHWSYYGEVEHAPGLLRDVQHEPLLEDMRDYTKDDGLMAILDPDGELGPFPYYYWGEYGPMQRRNFVRYLRDVRHFTLDDVSKRYYGKAGVLKDWADVKQPDWRTFYGWTDGAVDLAGEWRVMREQGQSGLRAGWQMANFNDSDWVRLTYPGDMTLYSLADPAHPQPLWMRRTLKVDPSRFHGPIYLSLAPLCVRPVDVFVNGQRIGAIEPRVWNFEAFGQFDVTDLVRKNPNLVVALRFTDVDGGLNSLPNGPMFLTSKALQDFPTDDPLLNAQRYDHFDFIDWATADCMGSMLRQIRSIDPDRPIKVHAFADSPWGWKVIQDLGGYSHHTGAGAGWTYTDPKQYGLERNLQDSAETGGSMTTPRNIKGLFGCLVYMGKNAHDYFHDLQDITHAPGMRDWLAARLPDIRVMGRENVHASPIATLRGLRNTFYIGEFYNTESWRNTYNLDRGGEMTPLLDEIRVGEGNLPYRAIIDASTLVWDEKMTAALEDYVKKGGILFLEAGSGLHTPTVRNAYPGAKLAGVQITGAGENPMQVILTVSDPVFGGLTGKVGPSYPHPMTESHAITPLPGTEVIGTTVQGAPAITRRALGKGAVYYCAGGLWPGPIQTGIANSLGPPVYVKIEGKGVDLARTCRSNNGCEELLMLRGLGGKPATVHWTFDFTPTAIYNPVTGAPIEAQINGQTATFTVNIDDWDFAWFAARRPDAPDQFAHWLQRQTEMWGGLYKGDPEPNPPLFRSLDLNRGWKLAQTDSQDTAEKLRSLDDASAKLAPTDLIWWSAPGTGLKSGPGVFGLYRRDFTLPAGWEKKATLQLDVMGQMYAWPEPGFGGPSTIYLNGTQIWSGDKIDASNFDVTSAIKPGANRLEIVHEGNGVMAAISLIRTLTPDTTIDLSGEWQAVDGLQAFHPVTLPGKVDASFIYRDLTIPKEQAGREVWLRVDTEDLASSRYVIINGRQRYPVTRIDNSRPMEVNITPEVRFGETNRILIGTGAMDAGWKSSFTVGGHHNFRKLELCFYAPGRWTGDGKGIADALTPAELKAVRRQEARVQLFPLVQNAVAKSPVNLFPFSDAAAAAYTPPDSILNLDLSASAGTVTDTAAEHVPVTLQGHTAHFSERGGSVTGLQIFAEDKPPGYLSLAAAPMQKLLTGKSFTICEWIKPMLDPPSAQSGLMRGTFVRWNNIFTWEISENGIVLDLNGQFTKRLVIDDVLDQRAWHFLTLVQDGNKSTIYVDGIAVGSRTWASPLIGVGAPFNIGASAGTDNFLNFKLASFTIYPGTLDEDAIGKLYVRDQNKFAGDPAKVWPEDYLCLLAFTPQGVNDRAEYPSEVKLGAGTTAASVEGRPVLNFDGADSSLLLPDHANVQLLASPFSMILDLNPAPGAHGCIFRRYNDLSLYLRQDGAIIFDANSGQHNNVIFPAAVVAGQWNRLMLTYDGKTLALFRDGSLLKRQDYPGSLSINTAPLCVGAVYNLGSGIFRDHLPMQLREFSIYPRVLDAVPPPLP